MRTAYRLLTKVV